MGNELDFYGDIRTPDIRMLHDMDEVLHDQEWLRSQGNIELYYMYRDLFKNGADHKKMVEKGLRYDITIIPPAMIGDEYIKTAGHYHPNVPGGDMSYPEVYQVLEGEATYLLQNGEYGNLSDVIVCKAKAGDIALIPPDYGHVTINASDSVLKMANWVCSNFSSEYEPVRKHEGAAYYLLEDGFVKNANYSEVPEIRYVGPMDHPEAGLFCGKDMYDLVDDLGKLDMLINPQDHLEIFAKIVSP
ncbi:glucose-6-phosphate isomerase family protein [Methanolobus sp. WCC4]|uniref:glucose-6-phosphate isomerase family protein n=1 Tax=Methanolobus sp. WCC4 TaxID=3125784 RepID=UPI0030F83A08